MAGDDDLAMRAAWLTKIKFILDKDNTVMSQVRITWAQYFRQRQDIIV
ncbi:MAG: hypothetical protein IPO33_18755 [Saprospiraceae bacterium]|nr:hypothetical protein [Candidatus Brachybacter algidus]